MKSRRPIRPGIRHARKDTVVLPYDGKSHTLTEWAKITGIPYQTLHNRYKKLEPWFPVSPVSGRKLPTPTYAAEILKPTRKPIVAVEKPERLTRDPLEAFTDAEVRTMQFYGADVTLSVTELRKRLCHARSRIAIIETLTTLGQPVPECLTAKPVFPVKPDDPFAGLTDEEFDSLKDSAKAMGVSMSDLRELMQDPAKRKEILEELRNTRDE
jgi:hypothetical protein